MSPKKKILTFEMLEPVNVWDFFAKIVVDWKSQDNLRSVTRCLGIEYPITVQKSWETEL